MVSDLEMFPQTRRTDPQTSHAAAARIAIRSHGWARQILDCLSDGGCYTDDEICTICHVPLRYWPSMKSARSRLTNKAGLVVASGEVRNGQTVWRKA